MCLTLVYMCQVIVLSIEEEKHVLHLTLVLEDWEHWLIIALDGVPSVRLTHFVNR